jgi:uncharacterized membrane protein
MKRGLGVWVSPAGAATALICFFLPWYDIACGEKIITQRGTDQGWPLWAIPVAAAGMLVAYGIAWWRRRDPSAARPAVLVLSLVLPAFLALLAYLSLTDNARFGFRPVLPNEDKYHAVRYGLVGEVAGLLAALVGTRWLRPRTGDASPSDPV